MGLKELLKRRRNSNLVHQIQQKTTHEEDSKQIPTSCPSPERGSDVHPSDGPQWCAEGDGGSDGSLVEAKRKECERCVDKEDVQDPFRRHVDRKLTDGEALRLSQHRAEYRPLSDAVTQEIWPNVEVETTDGWQGLSLRKSLSEGGVLQCVQQAWHQLHTERGAPLGMKDFKDTEQHVLFSMFSDYRNVFYNMKKYPTKEEGYDKDAVVDAAVLHCVNHVRWSKTRLQNRIHDRERAKKKRKQMKRETQERTKQETIHNYPTVGLTAEESEDERIFGFAFPKVLFLVPMRNNAYNIVRRILKLATPHQSGLDKVMEKLKVNYGPDEALEVAFKREKKTERRKPADHESIFYGHVADTVTIGIKMHLNGEVSVFRPLAESDIFIASPLSLSLMLEKKERETTDLLSSIEILVVDHAEVLLMQNWQHLLRSVQHLNQMPKETPADVNMLHVRHYFLQNQARCYRQTLLFSAFTTAEMNAFFNGPLCCNHAGRIRFRPSYDGVLSRSLSGRVLHRFERYPCTSPQEIAESRFHYFKTSTLPKIVESGVLLFVAHYFDFVRVCDLLKTEGVDFGAVSEYSGTMKSQRIRRKFRDGLIRILVTTERMVFYNRPRFKGIRSVVFYSLPDHAHFYSELITGKERITVLYSQFSGLQLERIVGSRTVLERKMMEGRDPITTIAA